MTEEHGSNGASEGPVFRMQKMYIKDFSFENPNAPEVYRLQNSEPNVDVNLKLNHKNLGDDHFEVSLQITAKIVDKGNNADCYQEHLPGNHYPSNIIGDYVENITQSYQAN